MYAKIFAQIFDSSIADDYKLRQFFMDLLVLADADGYVDMTPQAISARTRIPLRQVSEMIVILESPDPRSRTPDCDGRRIERLDEHRDWGWSIVNYKRFRQIASEEHRKAKQRERFHRWKDRKTGENPPANAPLTPANASNAMQRHKQRQMQKQNTEESVLVVEKRNVTLQMQCEIGKHFNRKPDDRWHYDEESKLVEVCRRPDVESEWLEIVRFRSEAAQYNEKLRATVKSLLENWQGELDRARNYKPPPSLDRHGRPEPENMLLRKIRNA